jgi:hypothetical protein
LGEQEKIDLITFIRGELAHVNDNIESIKDFIDIKYASKDALALAVEQRNTFCKIREEKLDAKFLPVYTMLLIIICFLCAKYGFAFFDVVRAIA